MKLDKYCARLGQRVTISGNRSEYYMIGDRKIRVSDHISRSTDAFLQIIETGDVFVVSDVASGEVRVLSYRKVQSFLRAIHDFPSLFTPKTDKNYIMGIHQNQLTEGQLHSVKMAISKHR